MRAICVTKQSESAESLKLELVEIDQPIPGKKECLVEVFASGVNPSDVKALLGKMPYLSWPRTPGRDYAGVVIEGPSENRKRGVGYRWRPWDEEGWESRTVCSNRSGGSEGET